MQSRITLIIHERLGNWARQLRPRMISPTLKVRETRSAADLALAVQQDRFALVVVDLRSGPAEMLADLNQNREQLADTLTLVLDPDQNPAAATLAQELGVTLVRSGFVSPPDIVRLLEQWALLAQQRINASGWFQPQTSGDLAALLG